MPDRAQEPLNLPAPTAPISVPAVAEVDLADEEDELAKQELARIMPSKEEPRKFAAKCGPLPKWLDEDEPPPF